MERMRRHGFGLLTVVAAAGFLLFTGCCSSSYAQTGSTTKAAQGSRYAAAGTTTGPTSGSLFHLLPADIQKTGKIVIGSAINYPPFENYAPDGKTLVGFEVELANALEQVLGIKFQWENASFDTLFASLKAGRYDIVYGATNDTPQREQTFNMLDYVQASQGFVVTKGNPDHIRAVADLCGKSVAAVTGGVQAQWLRSVGNNICKKAGKPEITVLTFAGASGEQLAVREGKAAALMENFPTAVVFARDSNGALELVPDLQVMKTYFAMVIPKSNPQLLDALQKGWDAIIHNGAYGKVLAKWGLSDLALPQSYVDGATTHPPAQ